MSETAQGIDPRYTLSLIQPNKPIRAIMQVLGAEIDGDRVLFWFESSKIKTAITLAVGDGVWLTRDK